MKRVSFCMFPRHKSIQIGIIFHKEQMLTLTVIFFFNLLTMCSLQQQQQQQPSDATTPYRTPLEIKDIMNVMTNVSDTFIANVNKKAKGNWTADNHFISEKPLQSFRNLISKHPVVDPQNKKFYMLHRELVPTILPLNFSVIENWPKCRKVILKVPKLFSTACSMGWVIAMVSVLTDRLCILSRGSIITELSPMEIVNCCKECSSHGENICSSGGDALMAWDFWLKHGIVSGDFSGASNNVGCKPYNKATALTSTSCYEECVISNSSKSSGNAFEVKDRQMQYRKEKSLYTFGKNLHVLPQGTKYIKSEIQRYGPVQTSFRLYEDFFVYKNGVYEHVYGEFIGYHSVKIIGWGEENNLHYWLIVNVWGEDFGINGTAKFLRGVNHCEIEENVLASDYAAGLNGSLLHTRVEPVQQMNSASHLVSSYQTISFIIYYCLYCIYCSIKYS